MSGFDITMYRDMFVEEAEELFESADNVLLEAENNGTLTDDEMGQLFRDVHTLKGSGASVELAYFAEFTHDVENMMDKLRNHQIEFIPEMAGTLIDGLDVMKEILQMECDGSIDRDTFTEKTSDLLTTIRSYMNNEGSTSSVSTPIISPIETSPDVAEVSSGTNNATTKSSNQSWGFFGEEAELEEESDANFGFFDDTDDITPMSEINVEKNEVLESAPTVISKPV
ncbi:MAG: Hpt domain-containing protein, partial [Arcobacteraceae bacterium]